MNKIIAFERRMGGRWTGITFHAETPTDSRVADRPMHFCDAVALSSTSNLILTPEHVNCPGAKLSFGWQDGNGSAYLKKMVQFTGLTPEVAKSLLDDTPKIKKGMISAVTIGDYDSPDILISYLQPEAAMRFVLLWQRANHKVLDVSLSSVMAVCGNVAAAAYKTQSVCCSFGCPESRRHGHIGRDRLIIGVPTGIIKESGLI